MTFHEGSIGWQLHPMEGDTGQAYMGIKNEEKVFLKKNSSPFLAALSIHGITPRLKWTKRSSNGDIFSAQEWYNGRSLLAEEMNSSEVATIVRTVHQSSSLLRMLKKVGGQLLPPQHMMESLKNECQEQELWSVVFIADIYGQLQDHQPEFDADRAVVNHGDMSRKNWLLTDQNKLFLVDWDGAVIADPAFDLGFILHHYIPRSSWDDWLKVYGIELTPSWSERIDWYGHWSLLHSICKFKQMNDEEKALACYKQLSQYYENK